MKGKCLHSTLKLGPSGFISSAIKQEWLLAVCNLRDYWGAMSRGSSTAKRILNNIIEAMRATPAKRVEEIAHDSGNWCSVRTTVQ